MTDQALLVMLALRAQKKLPENPQDYLVDFFGQYRDPMWDNMEEWTEENEQIENNIPILQSRITQLEQEIEVEKRRTWAYALFKNIDPDVTVSLLSPTNE